MGKIQVLDKAISELVAAGEVVERPASVIKELVENSIDAGASLITVEIQHGGVSYMRVSDNGCGIAPEDVPTAFLRHATSKIHSREDLEAIATLGFRGEAMASIAAVSHVELLTRCPDATEGCHFSLEGGGEGQLESAGCPAGTTIIVRDLFYNTPARMKFLKKDVSEGNAVTVVVEKAALSHPEISFKLIRDGQVKLLTPGDGKLLSAIHAALGKAVAAAMIPVDYEAFGLRVRGYVCRPTESRSNRSLQNFFLNGRYIHSKTMMAALEEAYRHVLMVGKFPSCVLNLEAPFGETDVNVHPTKIEVRFANEKSVFDVVYYGVKSALNQHDYNLSLGQSEGRKAPAVAQKAASPLPERMSAQQYRSLFGEQGKAQSLEKRIKTEYAVNMQSYAKAPLEEKKPASVDLHKSVSRQTAAPLPDGMLPLHNDPLPYVAEPKFAQVPISTQRPTPSTPDLLQRAAAWEEELPAAMEGKAAPAPAPQAPKAKAPEATPQEEETLPLRQEDYDSARLIGELFGTYILLENGDQLVIIDKHAAHERLLYEDLRRRDLTKDRQLLLEPQLIHLSREDSQAALENLETFQQLGFGLESFDGDLLLREVPLALPTCDLRAVVEEIAHRLARQNKDLTPQVLDELLHSIACRSAVKAHDKSAPLELEQLVELLRHNEDVRYCPHGRPIARLLSKRELEKLFGRIQ